MKKENQEREQEKSKSGEARGRKDTKDGIQHDNRMSFCIQRLGQRVNVKKDGSYFSRGGDQLERSLTVIFTVSDVSRPWLTTGSTCKWWSFAPPLGGCLPDVRSTCHGEIHHVRHSNISDTNWLCHAISVPARAPCSYRLMQLATAACDYNGTVTLAPLTIGWAMAGRPSVTRHCPNGYAYHQPCIAASLQFSHSDCKIVTRSLQRGQEVLKSHPPALPLYRGNESNDRYKTRLQLSRKSNRKAYKPLFQLYVNQPAGISFLLKW